MERIIDGVRVILHADDFGASKTVTENIMDVFRVGNLDSVSVLPNGNYYEESMKILEKTPELKYSIHFNITEGKALSEPEEIPDLVNKEGMFNVSFFKILVKSYLPGRKNLKRQIKCELKKQYELMSPRMKEIRIDSHQHFHMIPMVLTCILEIVKEDGRRIEFLRVPAEPLVPFLTSPAVLKTLKPMNIVKNLVLNVLAIMNINKLSEYRNRSAMFMGMCMSCEMDYKRVKVIFPKILANAKAKGRCFEVLAHPGQEVNESELMDQSNELCKEFYLSEQRLVEKDMFLRFNDLIK